MVVDPAAVVLDMIIMAPIGPLGDRIQGVPALLLCIKMTRALLTRRRHRR